MKFIITTDVLSASGQQVWSCEAKSKAEALEIFKRGDCVFEDENVEVTHIGEPHIEEE